MIPSVLPVYARPDALFVRGEGCYLYTAAGDRFLDFTAGFAVNLLGHAPPVLTKALTEQAGKLWHLSNLFRVDGQETLSRRLANCTFADTMFFGNSGVEAWECGIKMIRRYQYEQGHKKRRRVIVAEGAFHGRTLGAVSAVPGSEKMVKGFDPLLPGFDPVPYDDLDAVRAAITDETAGFCFEPVLGEGGVRPMRLETLRGLRQLADEHGLVLMFDEVQCGMGRTGKLFAHEWAGIVPDVMAVAKGLGGGFPVGACLATEKVGSAMGPSSHGSTFGGNPLAMAVASAVLDQVLAPGFLDHVVAMGDKLRHGLDALVQKYPHVFVSTRGTGLMQGLVCQQTNLDVVKALYDRHLLVPAAGDNVIRFVPPLIVGDVQLAEALAILADYAESVGK
jgi:acetylornithine/N-succinyldiaminopimelate aminotransferase